MCVLIFEDHQAQIVCLCAYRGVLLKPQIVFASLKESSASVLSQSWVCSELRISFVFCIFSVPFRQSGSLDLPRFVGVCFFSVPFRQLGSFDLLLFAHNLVIGDGVRDGSAWVCTRLVQFDPSDRHQVAGFEEIQSGSFLFWIEESGRIPLAFFCRSVLR